MARQNGRYLRRSIRQGGKVTCLYYGKGPISDVIEAAWQYEQTLREMAREFARDEREAELREFNEWKRETAAVDLVATIGIEALGYHRPGRNKWRKKRMKGRVSNAPAIVQEGSVAEKHESAVLNQMEELFLRATEGSDVEANVAKLRVLARQNPEIFAKCTVTSLSKQGFTLNLYRAYHRLLPGSDKSKVAAFVSVALEYLDNERERLLGSDSSPALQLAATVVNHAWADFWITETMAAPYGQTGGSSKLIERRRTQAQKRLMRALESFERLRVISKPTGVVMVALGRSQATLSRSPAITSEDPNVPVAPTLASY